jgi:protein-S-isoprenylcysteine O-methyltransferase Ste14
MSMSRDNAGVHFPPPLFFLFSILIGVGLHRIEPLPVIPQNLATAIGVVLAVVALSIACLGFRELRRHRTTIRPNAPSSTVVRTGPYRFSRNPLYLSLATLELGIGLATDNLWIVLMLLPTCLLLTRQVIAREEAYLDRAFGDEYRRYKASVRRWL